MLRLLLNIISKISHQVDNANFFLCLTKSESTRAGGLIRFSFNDDVVISDGNRLCFRNIYGGFFVQR